ncbi:DEKNAAC103739 [Brettanomyces naardenensis]|uniref:SURF1-like protein n=1 Tax=Brettanomyces naardenensis TaxID=13370 RepID=A0A448YP30_BRENA|nr:DEKNAAC103739 [Brettanomyces naardenensis]
MSFISTLKTIPKVVRRPLIVPILPIGIRSNQPCFRRSYATVKTPNIDWDPMKSGNDINKDNGSSFAHKAVFGVLCLAPIVTFCLGMWQVRRLKWKTKLINAAEDRLTYPTMPLPKNLDDEEITKGMMYRKVYITGEFDYSREIFVGPRLLEGREGYTLVCPFVQSNGGGDVLVERGWVASDKVIPESRRLQHLSCPQGVITIECVVKDPQRRGSLQMKHTKGARLFEYVDIDAMVEQSATRHLYLQAVDDFRDRPEWKHEEKETPAATPASKWWTLGLFGGDKETNEDLTASEIQKQQIKLLGDQSKGSDAAEFSPLQFMDAGVPIGKTPKVEFRNNHLQYLITWFSLSLASAVLLVVMIKKGKWVDPKQEKLRHAKKYLG